MTLTLAGALQQLSSRPIDDKFLPNLFTKIVSGVKASNSIAPDDFKYYESFPSFKGKAGMIGERILNLMGRLSDAIQEPESETNLSAVDDDMEKFNVVIESVDQSLEQVDLHLDDFLGVSKRDIGGDMIQKTSLQKPRGRDLWSRSAMKPQLKWKEKINNSNTAFVPIIKTKPNAIAPLRIELGSSDRKVDSSPPQPETEKSKPHPHPYQPEIDRFQYLPRQHSLVKEQLFRPLNEVRCHWIDSEEALGELAKKLNEDDVHEFAVDLEHHAYRSFLGFTCLMQISTRAEDFLIDCLEPSVRAKMHCLNDAFTNPRTVKVFHGADMDIQWLQRDFGIYVVNLFDTGQASRVLDFPSFGLAFLLKHYCDVTVDKKYQLADWRKRPLSAEMLLYARQDTHYLLYIYDRMKNEAIETSHARAGSLRAEPSRLISCSSSSSVAPSTSQSEIPHLLQQILDRSKGVSLVTYEKEIVDDTSHIALCNKYGLPLSEEKMHILHALYMWRDKIARERDESVGYVLPNHVMVNLCNTVPLDTQELLSSCRPVPPLVRQYAGDLVKLLQQAKLKSSVSPLITPTSRSSTSSTSSISPALSSTTDSKSSISSRGRSRSMVSDFDLNGPSTDEEGKETEENKENGLLSPPPKKKGRSRALSSASLSSKTSVSTSSSAMIITPMKKSNSTSSLDSTNSQGSAPSSPKPSLKHLSPPSTPSTPADEKRRRQRDLMDISPVMSTEDLYKEAGWIGPSPEKASSALRSIAGGEEGPEGPSGIPLFDLSDLLDSPHEKDRRKRDVESLVTVSPMPKDKKPPLFSFSMEDEKDTKLDPVRAKAAAIRASLSSSDVLSRFGIGGAGPSPYTGEFAPLPSSSHSHPAISSSSSLALPKVVNFLTTPERVVQQAPPSASPSPMKTPDTGTGIHLRANMTPPDPALASSVSPAVDPVVPKSVREIYKLSNQNRKKNKGKKKKKRKKGAEDSASDALLPPFQPDKKHEQQSTNQFMKDIGWIQEDSTSSHSSGSSTSSTTHPSQPHPSHPHPSHPLPPPSAKQPSSETQPQQRPFVPFDYSSQSRQGAPQEGGRGSRYSHSDPYGKPGSSAPTGRGQNTNPASAMQFTSNRTRMESGPRSFTYRQTAQPAPLPSYRAPPLKNRSFDSNPTHKGSGPASLPGRK